MSKKSIIVAAIIVVALGGAILYSQSNKSIAPQPMTAGQGRVVVGITDASTAIQGVSSIMVTVDKVEVQSATQEWVTVSSGAKQYDLLQLKKTGAVALLADMNLSAGMYNQIRLTVSKVFVTASGTVSEAKLPSGTLKIVGRLVVEEGKTATAVLDFKADKSLHITGNGKFILASVVNFKTMRDVEVERKSDDTLKIDGGKDEDEVNVGVDEHGEVKNNFELGVNAKVEIDAKDVIHVTGQNKGTISIDENDNNNADNQNEGEVNLNLLPENNSGIAGTAKLDNADGKVKVKLELAGVPTGILGLLGVSLGAAHPAHIHQGSCAAIGAVKYALSSSVDGESETTINASLTDLKAQLPLAINVHKSSEEIGVYVACADIKL